MRPIKMRQPSRIVRPGDPAMPPQPSEPSPPPYRIATAKVSTGPGTVIELVVGREDTELGQLLNILSPVPGVIECVYRHARRVYCGMPFVSTYREANVRLVDGTVPPPV
jgi:hypothetical protein